MELPPLVFETSVYTSSTTPAKSDLCSPRESFYKRQNNFDLKRATVFRLLTIPIDHQREKFVELRRIELLTS